jgi:hypothetical protein
MEADNPTLNTGGAWLPRGRGEQKRLGNSIASGHPVALQSGAVRCSQVQHNDLRRSVKGSRQGDVLLRALQHFL